MATSVWNELSPNKKTAKNEMSRKSAVPVNVGSGRTRPLKGIPEKQGLHYTSVSRMDRCSFSESLTINRVIVLFGESDN